MRIAFCGIGTMGGPMAGHLARVGHDVVVYNRNPARVEAWLSRHRGQAARTPREACTGVEVAFLCVGADADVRGVTLGDDGALAGLPPGSLLVDHTTASAEVAREMAAEAMNRDVGFVDAPVSGGQAGAEAGQLSVMCGGRDEDIARVRGVMGAYAKGVTHLGPVGSGQLCKMVNQICIAGVLAGLAEGLDFAVKAGLDPELVIGAISKGAARSWQMENRWRTMVAGEFDHGFAVDWMRKDLDICLHTADQIGADLPVTEEIDERYAEVQELGGGRWDTSSLIALLQRQD